MTVRIITGDCREVLPSLPADSFDCVVTSPPYFGLRDYGVEGQIGLEPTLAAYLETMVGVCRELRRVLKPGGVMFLNVGDSYAGSSRSNIFVPGNESKNGGVSNKNGVGYVEGFKPKDLMMVPNRLAIMLQDDGWWIRSEIIWHKPNPMPESVTDRPTCAHEKVWLLTKSERYFYDADAIKETAVAAGPGEMDGGSQKLPNGDNANAGRNYRDGKHIEYAETAVGSSKRRMAGFNERCDASELARKSDAGAINGRNVQATNSEADRRDAIGSFNNNPRLRGTFTRNARNVWSIASEPYRGAHYAVMPATLAERCIKAGSPAGGSVLDPFGGAGTTGLVADRLGRDATLIELNPANRELGAERVRMDGPLFAEVSA